MSETTSSITNAISERNTAQRILIVDDDPSVVSVLKEYLTQRGYEILSASTGRDAIILVDKHSPDLILLDIGLPEMSGIDVCRMLKQNSDTQMIPVIIITVHSSRAEKLEGLSAGADDFLSKPIDLDEMLPRLRAHLKMKTLYNDSLERYKEVEKLKDRNAFLTRIMIHDLKNPLTGIYGYLQIIRQGLETAKFTKHLDFVSRAMAGCEELNTVMSNLLDLIKLMDNKLPIEPEEFPLSDIVEGSINRITAIGDNTINVEKRTEDRGIKIKSDKALLNRIILGLIRYSLKTSNHKSPVNMAIKTDTNLITLTISSDGLDIPDVYRAILQRWTTSNISKQDASVDPGFTLAFCTLAAKALNCELTIDNTPKRQFRISIPVNKNI